MGIDLRERAQDALRKALAPRGMSVAISREAELSKSTVSQWDICPIEHIEIVERITGVPRSTLRPDIAELFGKPPPSESAAE